MFDKSALIALAFSGLAGLTTLLGAVIVFFFNKKSEKLITVSLAFAAGVMVCVSFAELYPEGRQLLALRYGNTFGTLAATAGFLGGILMAVILDKLVPHEEYSESTGEKGHKDLFRVGFISMLAMAMHNLPEGIATFMSSYQSVSLGIPIAIAIALHNIPEGITVAMPVYYATGSKAKAFKYCLISGMTEPLGALLAFFVLRPFITGVTLGAIYCFISGVMVYITIEELIPSSRQYSHNHAALLATFAGIIVMLLTQMF